MWPLVLFSVGKKKGIEEALLKNAAGGGGRARKRGRTRSAAPGAFLSKCQGLHQEPSQRSCMDCDAVPVLSEGRVVEMGPPRELVQTGGAFAGMVQQAAE